MNELITVSVKDGKIDFSNSDHPYVKHRALLIPIVENTPYIKSTTQATVNSLQRLTSAMRPNKSHVPFDQLHTGKTDDQVHEDLMILTKDLSNLMQRIVHSHSWREGTFESFDAAEISRQLESIQKMVDLYE
ncbi:hypothetical protein ABFV99_14055 [Cytobacillus horneckiae]|uniref:hypothetical protein n=1 Tax=Cytobacillus horneckiae TaxID=549687 RepID=UPI0034CD5B59